MPFRCRENECPYGYRDCFASGRSQPDDRTSSRRLTSRPGDRPASAWHSTGYGRRRARVRPSLVQWKWMRRGGRRRTSTGLKKLNAGRGAVGWWGRDRETNRVAARVVENTDRETLQGFVVEHTRPGSKVYTDEHGAYRGLPNHETVKHSVSEYVNGQAHTNGVESFWSMLKRGYHGTYHKMSPKHLQAVRQRVQRPSQHPRGGYC